MKKLVALMLLAVMLVTLTACGRSFTCDLCGEEKTGKNHPSKEAGIEMTICDECYKGLSELFGY